MIRPLWFSLGLASLLTGMIGAFLPLLPTTPFLLLSAYAFARSSPKLHDWLVHHPTFGPAIDNWQQHRAIARGAKAVALASIAVTLAASLILAVPTWIFAVQTTLLLMVAAFIITRPSPH